MASPPEFDETNAPDVEALLEELRVRVEERRRSGAYPPGLEEDLSKHFENVLRRRRVVRPAPDLRQALRSVDEALPIEAARIPVGSELPGGRVVHGLIARLLNRQTQGTLEQVQAFASPVQATLIALVEAVEEILRLLEQEIAVQLDGMSERQAGHERALALLHSVPTVPAHTPSEAEHNLEWRAARSRRLAERMVGFGPVVGLSSGDQALLQAFASKGIESSVLDADQAAERLADGSLGGLVHMQHGQPLGGLIEFVALAARTLRPGGRALVDICSAPFVHPADVTFLFREAGFSTVEIEWDTRAVESADESMVERLSQRLSAPTSYLVLATR